MKYLPKVKKYLKTYYSYHGVGNTIKQKLAHFNSLYSNVVYSVKVSDKIKVLLFEQEILGPEFGEDIYAD